MFAELAVAVILGYTPLEVPNHQITPQGHVIILETIGGRVGPFASIFDHWNRLNKTLIIKGLCGSACTMALDNPKACAMPKAMFTFHQARAWNPLTGELGEPSERANHMLWSRYPDKVKAIVKELTPELRYFKGTDLLPPCPKHIPPDPSAIAIAR